MLYDFKQGRTAAECHRSFCNAFGEDVISERQCRRRFQRFRDGDETLEDEEHQRRPQAVDNEALKEAIESDPCQTTRELAEMSPEGGEVSLIKKENIVQVYEKAIL